uniref:Putative secreted protein n=1 Tax=Ixodes ricinus TaxID=34613 RepID=A0A6B0UP21_IXORI
MCWSLVSGCIQLVLQRILRGQPLNTLEKQAPMCTFGVGGRPLLTGFRGVLATRCVRFFSFLRGGASGRYPLECTFSWPSSLDPCSISDSPSSCFSRVPVGVGLFSWASSGPSPSMSVSSMA